MTNFEYYKGQLLSFANKNLNVGLIDDNPIACHAIMCRDCQFNQGDVGCGSNRMRWLYEEHIEKPTITKQERAFLETCRPGCYIARDADGHVFIFESKPNKRYRSWNGDCSTLSLTHYRGILFDIGNEEDLYPFIKWEDEKPWKVEDLLKLEVKC